MSNNNKNCILYLIRSSDEDLEMLNKSLELLQKNLLSSLKQDVDILIFHEKDFESYKDNVLKLKNMKFVEIEFKMPDYPKEIMDQIPELYEHPTHGKNGNYKLENGDWHRGFTLSYRAMCNWFSGELYEHSIMKNYKYYLRLDNDSFIWSKVPYDIFEFIKNNHYSYVTIEPGIQIDHPKVCYNLNNEVKKWLIENNIETEINIDTIPNGKMYYTNFELAETNWFSSGIYKEFYDFIDKNGWIFSRRYGDAIIKYLGVQLFMKKEKIGYTRGWNYQHGACYNL